MEQSSWTPLQTPATAPSPGPNTTVSSPTPATLHVDTAPSLPQNNPVSPPRRASMP
jgi:hypothetical protein